jgi:hypothetical protein
MQLSHCLVTDKSTGHQKGEMEGQRERKAEDERKGAQLI